ncbi:MAG: methylaspartate mutase, partial [Candidatus Zixiibacteriota bacterium]
KLGFGEDGLPLTAKANLRPDRHFDIGRGKGNTVHKDLSGGVVGIILDGRGRPFDLPADPKTRVAKLKEWMLELDIYLRERLEGL